MWVSCGLADSALPRQLTAEGKALRHFGFSGEILRQRSGIESSVQCVVSRRLADDRRHCFGLASPWTGAFAVAVGG